MNINFRVPNTNFRVLNTTFRVLNTTFRVLNTNFRVLNINFRVPNINFRVLNSNFRVLNTIFRVSISKDECISLNDQLRNSKRLIISTMRSPFLFLCVVPVASPLALASPFGRRGDAARTSRGTARAHWLLCASAVACGKPLRVVQSSFRQ
ncbi:hypothetical protein [Nostoc sp.]|uniref:hypothetical protein n=1 Tax=Nostoc sp. TaxID=1180 RepID=UPI002FF89FD9